MTIDKCREENGQRYSVACVYNYQVLSTRALMLHFQLFLGRACCVFHFTLVRISLAISGTHRAVDASTWFQLALNRLFAWTFVRFFDIFLRQASSGFHVTFVAVGGAITATDRSVVHRTHEEAL
eukprot:GHVO01047600.1.p1 GENE.GHVO01047600.1~~GHVO01047600.1.p1  ORF type:complete len:124 (+),score=9.14 GHVO01047600.1:57-428(+)